MAKKIIRVGDTANDKKGDSLRSAFIKVNENFTELYEAVGLAAAADQDTTLTFLGSTISTDDSSGIVIDRVTTVSSNLNVGGDIVPQNANGGDLGSSTLPWRSLYVSNNTIYIGGTAVGVDANGNLTTGGTVVGSTPTWDSITGKPTIPTLVSQLSNDSGFLTSVGNISNIQSESDVSIRINLTDSTTRIWQFGEDGDLVFPDGTVQNTAWTGSTTVSSLVNGSKTVSLDGSLGNLTFTNGEQIKTNGGGELQLYQSSDNTITILPGEVRIKAYGGGGGAKYEWDFDSTGRTTFPNGVVPAHSYGAAGDKEGMVVFTDPYIYYCKSDFRPLVTYTAAVSQNGGSTFEVYQTAGTPLINDHLYGYGDVGEGLITNVQASTEGGQPTWLLTVNQIGGTSIGLTANQPCTIGTPDIWVRVAWTGTSW
jgi:hypothetical protein